jgi:uncharacterized membrane protein
MNWRRIDRWLVAVLIPVALALRLTAIGRESLWFDEAVSYLAAELPSAKILNNAVQSSHPPFYYLLLHFWLSVVPDGDGMARLLGALWNVLLVPAVYLLAKELLDSRRLALMAAVVVVISPFHVLFSHELRMYTQLMTLVVIGTWAYLRAGTPVDRSVMPDRRWPYWLLFLVCFAGATYTHLFAWLALAAVAAHALIHHRDRHTLWRTLAVLAVLTIIFVPWMVVLAGEGQKDLGSMRPLAQESGLNPLKPLTSLAFLVFGMSTDLAFTGAALFLSLSILAVGLLELRKAWLMGQAAGLLLPGLMVLFVIGVPVAVYLIRPFFLPERTMAAAAPFLALWLAWGTSRRGSPLPYLVLAAAITMVAGTVLYLAGGSIKPPYRAVMDYATAHRQVGDAVLHTSDGSYLPGLRYADFERHGLLAGDPDPRKPLEVYYVVGGQIWTHTEAEAAGDRLWLIVALEHSIEWQEDQVAYFAEKYQRLENHDFEGIALYLYQIQK